jgi:IMP dehydrogenase
MSVEEQARQLRKVKRADNMVIHDPVKIAPDRPLSYAKELMADYDIGGIMVVDEQNHLLGILTSRDTLFKSDKMLVSECMTPRARMVVGKPDISMEEARAIFSEKRLEKLPLVNGNDELAGLVTAKDLVKLETNTNATRDSDGNLIVGAAVGVKTEDHERCQALFEAGADLFVVDIAHGHSLHTIQMVRWIHQQHPEVKIVAGNVATYEGTLDLLKAGADVIKVGVGSGSICITRIVTGFGVPQLTAIMESARAIADFGRGEIIADGGIRTSGDIVKALAAGAQAVMVGNLVAGTDQAPGRAFTKGGKKYKAIRGMASLSANIARKKVDNQPIAEETFDRIVPEGVEAVVPYRGAVTEIIYQLVGGLRSGMSYAGAHSIAELQQNAVFVKITNAGQVESGAHDVDVS